MRVMVLVKATVDSEAGLMPRSDMMEAMGRYNELLVEAGIMKEGDGLKPSSQGKRVAFDGDSRTVIDGPFAETKEQLLGFYLVDCDDLEQALDVARDLARANPGGAYELRPVGVYYQSQLPADGATAAQ